MLCCDVMRDAALMFFPFYELNCSNVSKRQLLRSMQKLLNKHSSSTFSWIISIARGYGVCVYDRQKNFYNFSAKNYEKMLAETKISTTDIQIWLSYVLKEGENWEEIKAELSN